MAQPANTFDTYDAKGIREDLQDAIYNVSPESTPCVSAIRRFSANNTLHEWQRDSLRTPNADNAVIEGDERTGVARTPTERVGNYTQLFDDTIVITTDVETVNKAGRSSEAGYQRRKGFTQLKRDLEASVLSNNAAVAGNSTTARKSAGLGAMLYTNVDHGSGGSTPSHTSGAATTAPTGGTARAFAESQLKSVMESIFTNSGDMPKLISMTPSHKGGFSAFTGIALNRFEIPKNSQATIIGGADVYMSDFGQLTVVPNYVQASANDSTVFILNPNEAGVAYRQNFKKDTLAKTGHTDKELLSVEATLVVTSEAAHGKIADLTA